MSTSSDPDPIDEPTLMLTDIHDLLRMGRRVAILDVLNALGGDIEKTELVDAVAGRLGEERQNVHSGMTHSHIPKLEAHDVVEVVDGHHYRKGPNFETVYNIRMAAEEVYTNEPWQKGVPK